jgi:hypothetical protein
VVSEQILAAVPAVLASAYEHSVPIFQQLSGVVGLTKSAAVGGRSLAEERLPNEVPSAGVSASLLMPSWD